MKNRLRSRSLLSMSALAFGLLLTASSAALATPAVTFDNLTGEALANGPFTLGFEFSVSSSISVTALGVFDDSQDGLGSDHAVGIWDSAGTLLASQTVGAGTVDPLTNQFRYASITPLTLGPGTYEIGALWLDGTDPNLFPADALNFATASGITFIQDSFIAGGLLADPTGSLGTDPAYFGPNFLFSASSNVPEPITLSLFGAGLAGAAAFRRRRSKSV